MPELLKTSRKIGLETTVLEWTRTRLFKGSVKENDTCMKKVSHQGCSEYRTIGFHRLLALLKWNEISKLVLHQCG